MGHRNSQWCFFGTRETVNGCFCGSEKQKQDLHQRQETFFVFRFDHQKRVSVFLGQRNRDVFVVSDKAVMFRVGNPPPPPTVLKNTSTAN